MAGFNFSRTWNSFNLIQTISMTFIALIKSSLILGWSFQQKFIALKSKFQISDFSMKKNIVDEYMLSNSRPNINPFGIP